MNTLQFTICLVAAVSLGFIIGAIWMHGRNTVTINRLIDKLNSSAGDLEKAVKRNNEEWT